jgi:hypothetical protein
MISEPQTDAKLKIRTHHFHSEQGVDHVDFGGGLHLGENPLQVLPPQLETRTRRHCRRTPRHNAIGEGKQESEFVPDLA